MESGKPSADQVAPLDKWGRGGTIFKFVGAKIHGVGQEYSWSSSPCHEELCNGYAASLVSAPRGPLSRRRVC
jgi:hypothetical protein